jgi:hypothetical protein
LYPFPVPALVILFPHTLQTGGRFRETGITDLIRSFSRLILPVL